MTDTPNAFGCPAAGTIINALVANDRYSNRPWWHVSRVVFDRGEWWELAWIRGSTSSKKRAREEAKEHGVALSQLEFQRAAPDVNGVRGNLLERLP